jgi:5-methylcytosine-specific restriction endonuclease McrA
MCEQAGRLAAASVVDHREPHKGDVAKFWDQSGWQSLCAKCHNAAKQSEDRTGRVRGCDANGLPLDPAHPWNRGHPPKGAV